MDQTDIAKAKAVLGSKFCLSGNVPNSLMAYGTKEQVREYVKRLLDEYAAGCLCLSLSVVVGTEIILWEKRV